MVSPPTINTPTNFGAAQSRVAVKTSNMDTFILMSGEQSIAGNAAQFIANRFVLPFAKGTDQFVAKINPGKNGNKDWYSFLGWAKNTSADKTAAQLSQRAFNEAVAKGLAVKHATGWVITVNGTVGGDGWFKTEALKGTSFDANAAAAHLTAIEKGAAPTTTITPVNQEL